MNEGNRQPSPNLRPITAYKLARAQSRCSASRALPPDWDNWFPQNVALLVDINGAEITAGNIEEYATRLLLDPANPYRHLEAAQCLALLHYLGSPSKDTIVTSVYG